MSAPDANILNEANTWLDAGRKLALATVIETWGSAPQPTGSQLVIDEEGNFLGSVSGGCVEGAVVTEAIDVIGSGEGKVLEFGVADETALGGRPGLRWAHQDLRGAVGALSGMKRALLQKVLDAKAHRQAVAVVTHLASGEQRLIERQTAGQDALADVLETAFRFDKSQVVTQGDEEYFVDIHNPPLKMVMVGAVHIAQALIPMAQATGYDVTIIDPRGAFATEERFPNVSLIAEWPDEVLDEVGLDTRTAMVALTHDPKIDDPALTMALKSEVFYIGALGSKRTHAGRLERLKQHQFSDADLARIKGPIGLHIGAKGQAEIAVAIMAQVIEHLRLGDQVS